MPEYQISIARRERRTCLSVDRFIIVHSAPCDAHLVRDAVMAVRRGDPLPRGSCEVDVLKSERDAFTLRLKPELFAFVKDAAEDENRSVPNFVETVLLAEKRRREALNASQIEVK